MTYQVTGEVLHEWIGIGISMSGHAVPFLYGMAPMQFTRRMHLSMSYWTFVLMGLHLGMHVTTMFAGLHLKKTAKNLCYKRGHRFA